MPLLSSTRSPGGRSRTSRSFSAVFPCLPTYPPLPGLPRIWTILSCPPFLLDCLWFYFECLGWIHFLWPHRQCICCHQEESTACAAPGTPQSRVGLDLQCLELVLIFKTFCTLKIHMLNSRFIFRGCVIVRPVSSQFRHIDSYNFFSFLFLFGWKFNCISIIWDLWSTKLKARLDVTVVKY